MFWKVFRKRSRGVVRMLPGIEMEEGLINKIVTEKNKRHVFCVTKYRYILQWYNLVYIINFNSYDKA